ncbi:MAG: NADH-quinone oxidoreductase subunit NuoG [Spirochaetia bacterium]
MKTYHLTIDGRRYDVDAEGKNLLHVCLSLGLNLPYFCWHPALHSVGACRQCAVKLFKDESDTKGRVIMSCMTPVTDGMRISIEDPEARMFRGQVTEWLMVNHPHDCPICDEGGECHLQDMVVMTGHAYRRYRFTKRTHRNQDLGPFVNHEMNRCIQCYRCIRFYRDYAGGRDLEALGAHDDVYFGRQTDGALENEFSGNLVEVCPTGVFTDKTLKMHYARKWDLQTAPSLCVHCAVGCNTIPGERYGTLRRVRTRYNGEVNGYFLCDRGRYGYEFVNGARRLRQPLVRADSTPRQATAADAVSRASQAVSRAASSGAATIGIGSPRASLETNYALRSLVGPANFYLGVRDHHLEILRLMTRVLREGPAPAASVRQAGKSDAVLILGEDVWNTAPILALNLRQASTNAPAAAAMKEKKLNAWDDAAIRGAIKHEKGPFFVASVEETKLDEVARERHRLRPSEIALLGFAVAHEIDISAPGPTGLPEGVLQAARRIAAALNAADHPLVVSGAGLAAPEVIMAAANVARALKKTGRDARISLVVPEVNSLGAALLAAGGLDAAARALSARSGQVLVVAESDVFREMPSKSARALLASADRVVAVDHTTHATTEAAEIVLPSCTYAESSGSMVSSEGRAQRFFSVFPPVEPAQSAWRWLDEIAVRAGRKTTAWKGLDEVIHAMTEELPELRGVRDAAPGADYRLRGSRVPRKSLRESGRTAVTANVNLHEPQPPRDPDSPLAYTMEGASVGAPAGLNARFWSPGWNSDQSLSKFQAEVSGQLVGGDPGVRLFEPPAGAAGSWFPPAAAAPAARDETLLLVPRHHVFGSEELSSLSPGIALRTAPAAVAMSRTECEKRGLQQGDRARLTVDGVDVEMAVAVSDMPDGVASVPPGVPGMPVLSLPGRATVSAAAVAAATAGDITASAEAGR